MIIIKYAFDFISISNQVVLCILVKKLSKVNKRQTYYSSSLTSSNVLRIS